MASIRALYDAAIAKPNGYQAAKTPAYAVSVAVGPAAANRGHQGQVVIAAEWYRPEAFDDDDTSVGGYLIPIRSGQTRVSRSIVVDHRLIDSAADQIRGLVPRGIADVIDA